MAKITKVTEVETNIVSTYNTEARKTALQTAREAIEKEFGKGSVIKIGDKVEDIPVISSGFLSLDIALGVKGFPRGRIVEIYGPEGSGKTTICLQLAAQTHAIGGTVAIVDTEHALDLRYAKALGVKIDELLLSQPENAEQALTITEQWARSGAVDLIIVDSVAALVPRSEIEGEMGDAQMGLQARLMSQAMRKLTGVVSKSNTILCFTNQLRQKIGVMFGNPETTTGGNALKFYASVRLDIRRIETLKDGTNSIGSRTKIKVVKNKVAPPFKETIVDILYGKGVDIFADLVDLAIEMNVIEKAGSWFSYKDKQIGQGRDAVKKYLSDNLAELTVIREAIITQMK